MIRYITIKKMKLFCVFTLLGIIGNTQAQVAYYEFSQTQGTYTALSQPTVLATATSAQGSGSLDETIYTLPPGSLPFSFTFNQEAYTGLIIYSNGYISFGDYHSIKNKPISQADNANLKGVISAFGADLNGKYNIAGKTAQIAYTTIGTAPNRTFVVEWSNFRFYSTSTLITNSYTFNFQIHLHENGTIDVVYDLSVLGTPTGGIPEVGLRGATATDFNSRKANGVATSNWQNATAATANTDGITTNSATLPVSGLTYTWAPSDFCLPVFQYGPDSEMITRVIFNTIDKTSPFQSGSTPQYEDFTSESTTVSKGLTYELAVKGPAGSFPSDVMAYIDLNQNGLFDDPGESFYIGRLQPANPANAHTVTATLTIPVTALSGNTKMRIVKNSNINALDNSNAEHSISGPCADNLRSGQVEDYSLIIEEGTTVTDYCSVEQSYTLPIYEFTVNNFVKTSSNQTDNALSYENFTAETITLTKESSNTVTIKGKTDGQTNVLTKIYIDLNRDFTFSENETFEIGYLSNTGNENGEVSNTFQISETALTGPTRMRVVNMYHNPESTMGTFINSPCPTGWFLGQVEDYTVNIEEDNASVCTNTMPGNTPGDTGCVTLTINGENVVYTTVRAADGNVWLQQNLGSTQVAGTMTDELSYGGYYQWGRWTDGHEKSTSGTAGVPTPNNPSGITAPIPTFFTGQPEWWASFASTDTWSANSITEVSDNEACDPCKAIGNGWQLPSEQDWTTLQNTENINNPSSAFASHLRLPANGYRSGSNGNFTFKDQRGYYWSSTTSSIGAKYFYVGTTIGNPSAGAPRSQGHAIRCIYKLASEVPVTAVTVATQNNAQPAITTTNGTLALTATVAPAAANQHVTWTVPAGSEFVSVDASGTVTAIANGTATVRATSVTDTTKFDEIDITVAITAVPADPYCNVSVDYDVEPITSVQLADINNTSSAVVNATPVYENFTSITGNVTKGTTYQLKVKGNTVGQFTHDIRVFIDWNQDYTFDMDTEYYHADLLPSNGIDNVEAVISLTIPADATLGQTRMRIIKDQWNIYEEGDFDACTNAYYGQVEDYTLHIQEGTAEIITNVTVSTQNNADPVINTINGTLPLTAVVNPLTVNQNVTWSVASGDEFVSVNTTGIVTAIANGTATVRATSVADITKFGELEITVNSEDPVSPCQAVETFFYTFDDFTAFPEQCWAASHGTPMVSLSGNSNKVVQLYSLMSGTTDFYIVSPPVSTIDGQHILVFDITSASAQGMYLQVGTMPDQTDFTGFVAAEESFVPVTGSHHQSVAIPAHNGHQFVAIKFTPNGNHKSVQLDNIEWKLKTGAGTDDFIQDQVSLYPNPTTGIVTIDSDIAVKEVILYDMTGKKVIQTQKTQLDLSSLSSGIYHAKITLVNHKSGMIKIVKK